MWSKFFLLALIFWAGFKIIFGEEYAYLKEKPDFLKTCKRSDAAEFPTCMVKAFQNIFTNWKGGILGFDPIDPVFVPLIDVIGDNGSGAALSIRAENITSTGLNKAEVKKVAFKDNSYDFKMTYVVPKVTMKGKYSAKGQVLLLKLDAKGDMFMELDNAYYTVTTKVKLETHDNEKFLHLKALKFEIDSLEGMRFYYSNLFKDKDLTDNTNAVFNENWRLFYDSFKHTTEKEINKVMLRTLRGIFDHVPAKFFIAEVGEESS